MKIKKMMKFFVNNQTWEEKENQCEYIEQAADETIKMMLVVILPISFPSFLWLFTWKIFVFGHSGRKKNPHTTTS